MGGIGAVSPHTRRASCFSQRSHIASAVSSRNGRAGDEMRGLRGEWDGKRQRAFFLFPSSFPWTLFAFLSVCDLRLSVAPLKMARLSSVWIRSAAFTRGCMVDTVNSARNYSGVFPLPFSRDALSTGERCNGLREILPPAALSFFLFFFFWRPLWQTGRTQTRHCRRNCFFSFIGPLFTRPPLFGVVSTRMLGGLFCFCFDPFLSPPPSPHASPEHAPLLSLTWLPSLCC